MYFGVIAHDESDRATYLGGRPEKASRRLRQRALYREVEQHNDRIFRKTHRDVSSHQSVLCEERSELSTRIPLISDLYPCGAWWPLGDLQHDRPGYREILRVNAKICERQGLEWLLLCRHDAFEVGEACVGQLLGHRYHRGGLRAYCE